MYCPLMSFAKQYSNEQQCLGEECAFAADKAGNCLVKQALQCYVNKTHLENEEKKAFTRTYVGKPYDVHYFETEGSIKPAWPHGGVYDATPSYDNIPF